MFAREHKRRRRRHAGVSSAGAARRPPELAEKGADVDVLRQMVQFMAQRLMDLDVETLCGGAYDEKNAERLNSRNGYRDRVWETRAGGVDLKLLKLRKGSYFLEFLEPRRTAEKALAAVIQEAYVHEFPRAPCTIWSRRSG